MPFSATFRLTVRALAGAGLAVMVKVAVPPSVIDVGLAATVTVGWASGSAAPHARACRVRTVRSHLELLNSLCQLWAVATSIADAPLFTPRAASTRFQRFWWAGALLLSRQAVTSATVTASDGISQAGAGSSSSVTATVAEPAVVDTV